MTFIHAADLHLSTSEEDYGFSVLDELLSLAAGRADGLLLLAGDVFDSWADLEALRGRFRQSVEAFPGLRVLVAAGNHDLSGAPRDPERYDFGQRVIWAWSEALPVELPGARALLLPWGRVPASAADGGGDKAPPLVILAHGALPRMNWLGPREEEGAGARGNLDEASLLGLRPAYVAMGHIHEGRHARMEGATFAYPGSARVWRRGEEGERQALRVSLDGQGRVEMEALAIQAAGRYVKMDAELKDDGSLPVEALERFIAAAGRADWLDLRLSGLAAREAPLLQAAQDFSIRARKRLRKVELDCSQVVYLGEEAGSAAAAAYRKAWEAMLPQLEREHGAAAARRALATGLKRIAAARTGAAS